MRNFSKNYFKLILLMYFLFWNFRCWFRQRYRWDANLLVEIVKLSQI